MTWLTHQNIRRLAVQFIGRDRAAIITAMKQHEAARIAAQRKWEVTRNWLDRDEAQRESALEVAARLRLAIDFGAIHGWTLTTKPFGLRTLGEGKCHDGRGQHDVLGRNPRTGQFHSQFDHPYYYRRHRQTAAIAAHLYSYDACKKAECKKIAARFGLEFEEPDFPSWWNPGGTILVVYIGPGGRNREMPKKETQ